MMEYLCFFPSGSDTSFSSLQDFLLCINDQHCVGFEEILRHAGTKIGKLLLKRLSMISIFLPTGEMLASIEEIVEKYMPLTELTIHFAGPAGSKTLHSQR